MASGPCNHTQERNMIPASETENTPVWRRNIDDIVSDMEEFISLGVSAIISPEEMEIVLENLRK